MPGLQDVELSKLVESKTNPRQIFDKARMAELIASIEQSGVIDPLLVRSTKNAHFEIVDGARRFRAAVAAKVATVPVIVRQLSDEEALELQILSNDQRVDVHPLEQGTGYQHLQKELKLTLDQVAKRVGKAPAYVAKRLRFTALIDPLRKMFLANEIGIGHATLLSRLTAEQQKEIAKVIRGDVSVDWLRDQIERTFFLLIKDAPFDTTQQTLYVEAGACDTCPKRTGFNALLFDDAHLQKNDTCTDRTCFEEKTRRFIKIQVGTHKDAVLLSLADEYNRSSQPKHLTAWIKAGSKTCPDTKQGIAVERVSYHIPEERTVKLGHVVKVCTNLKCKTHFPSQPRGESDYNSSTGGSKKAEKARKIELRRRGLVFKELAADQFDVKQTDYRTILDWAIRGLNNDHARAVCLAMEWEPVTGKFKDRDYTATIAKNLAKLTHDGVENWLYLLMLADTDLWFYNNTKVEKPKLLEAKAQASGVALAELAKQAKLKPAKAAKAAPKK